MKYNITMRTDSGLIKFGTDNFNNFQKIFNHIVDSEGIHWVSVNGLRSVQHPLSQDVKHLFRFGA